MKIKVLKMIMEVYDTKSSNVFISVNYYKSLLLKSKKSKSFKYFSYEIFKKIKISCHAFPKQNLSTMSYKSTEFFKFYQSRNAEFDKYHQPI